MRLGTEIHTIKDFKLVGRSMCPIEDGEVVFRCKICLGEEKLTLQFFLKAKKGFPSL